MASGVMAARSCHDLTPAGNFARTPPCIGLPRNMVGSLGGPVGQVVALGEQLHLPGHDLRLGGLHPLADRLEVVGNHHGGVARRTRLLAVGRRGAKHPSGHEHPKKRPHWASPSGACCGRRCPTSYRHPPDYGQSMQAARSARYDLGRRGPRLRSRLVAGG